MTDAADRAEAKQARRIAAAFRDAVGKARARVDRAALVDSLARGDRYGAQRIVAAALGAEGLAAVEAAWGHAASDAGRTAADEAPDLPAPTAKRLTFNFLSGGTPGLLSRWASQLRQSLEAILRNAVSAVLDRWLGRADPEQVADAVLAALGLSERDVQRVANYRTYLENLDRAALRSQLRDARNDPRILDAIRQQDPLPPEYVDSLVARYAAKLEATRADLIGKVEAARARSTGEYGMWQQQIDTGQIDANALVKVWHHKHDNRVRDTHLSIPAIQPEGVPFGNVFVTSAGNRLRFPHDPAAPIEETIQCRCHLTYEVRSEALAA
jgi:hypothetical protein